MKNRNKFVVAIMIGVLYLITVTTPILAQDWPQWLGMNRDGKVTGFKAPKTWPDELTC